MSKRLKNSNEFSLTKGSAMCYSIYLEGKLLTNFDIQFMYSKTSDYNFIFWACNL